MIPPYAWIALTWAVCMGLMDAIYTAFWVPLDVAFCTASYGNPRSVGRHGGQVPVTYSVRAFGPSLAGSVHTCVSPPVSTMSTVQLVKCLVRCLHQTLRQTARQRLRASVAFRYCVPLCSACVADHCCCCCRCTQRSRNV